MGTGCLEEVGGLAGICSHPPRQPRPRTVWDAVEIQQSQGGGPLEALGSSLFAADGEVVGQWAGGRHQVGAAQAQWQACPPIGQPVLRQSGEALTPALVIGSKDACLKASSCLATHTRFKTLVVQLLSV